MVEVKHLEHQTKRGRGDYTKHRMLYWSGSAPALICWVWDRRCVYHLQKLPGAAQHCSMPLAISQSLQSPAHIGSNTSASTSTATHQPAHQVKAKIPLHGDHFLSSTILDSASCQSPRTNNEHNHGHAVVTKLAAAASHAHGCQSSLHAYTMLLIKGRYKRVGAG